jgi:flagellar protein FliO/FliZ
MLEFGFSPLLKSAGALLLLLGCLLAGYYVIKRFGHRFGLSPKRSRNAPQVKGQLSLGPKHRIAVVAFRGKTMLLGVTDHSINLLTVMDDEDQNGAKDTDDEVFKKFLDQADADRAAD